MKSMFDYIYNPESGELYHYGVKGMKWGVRRYQNKDGSLTPRGQKRLANKLKKDYKKNYSSAHPYKTSDTYKKTLGDAVDGHITDADKKRIKITKDKWRADAGKANDAEEALFRLAEDYGKKYYDNELRKNPDLYPTPRAKDRLYDYAHYDYGYDAAARARPDLVKLVNTANDSYNAYREECKKATDKLLGAYGDTKLYECQYYSYSIRDTVGDYIMTKDANEWKL